MEIRKHRRDGMSPERDLTEEPEDATMAKLVPSQLPVMVTWVSLGIVLGLLRALRSASGRVGQSLALSLSGFSQRTWCHPSRFFPSLEVLSIAEETAAWLLAAS